MTDDEAADFATIVEALDRAGGMAARDPRDWGLCRRDAWLFGLLCGWDCEDHLLNPKHVHNHVCADGDAMRLVADRHRWADEDVARLRRYRAAIAARIHARRSGGEGNT